MARNGGDERRREEASTSASTVLHERVPAPASVEGLGPTVVDFMNKRSMLAEDGDTEALATLERNFVTAADPDTLLALIRVTDHSIKPLFASFRVSIQSVVSNPLVLLYA